MQIEVIDYPIFVRLGCFKEERLAGQEIRVSLNAQIHLRAPWLDNLTLTLDYGLLISTLMDVVHNKEFHLVESVVLTIGEELIKRFSKIKTVCVTVEKPVIPSGLMRGATVRVKETFSQPKQQNRNSNPQTL